MNITLLPTADGSLTLYVAPLDETYHSRHGAMQESEYVFIRNGLLYALAQPRTALYVLEVGFGTGLNAWLTCRLAEARQCFIYYTAIEAYPLPEVWWRQLNYAPHQAEAFAQLHQAAWGTAVRLHPWFTLTKVHTKLEDAQLPAGHFDVVYFDAFAPNRQPELWAPHMLAKTTSALRSGGVWVTYSARGEVRRNLMALGLQVERLPGPPGKKHMLRAVAP
jgi:tRNA U34 5-methylaminomethyl-2-thiouridine-forming methyltransferase MnmC